MTAIKEKSLLFKMDCENTIEQFNFDYELKTKNLKISYKFKSEAESFFKHILNEMHQNLEARDVTGMFECKVELRYQHNIDKAVLGLSLKDISKVGFYEEVQTHDFKDIQVEKEFVEMALDIQQQYLEAQIFVF